MADRERELTTLQGLLKRHPVVAIVGARQVGKTTLARMLVELWNRPVEFYDLEDPDDAMRLADPMLGLRNRSGLVVIDEVQRHPDLFPVLRVLADRSNLPCRFLILGSASPELLKQSAESLAGRIAYHYLTPSQSPASLYQRQRASPCVAEPANHGRPGGTPESRRIQGRLRAGSGSTPWKSFTGARSRFRLPMAFMRLHWVVCWRTSVRYGD